MEYISTTQLAKNRDLNAADVFQLLKEKGWIYKKDDKWHLTKEGRMAGGDTRYNPKFGEFIVWPSDIDFNASVDDEDTLSCSNVGAEFMVSAQKINIILNELGWIEKDSYKGWKLTSQGRTNGGVELETMNGNPYVVWKRSILTNKIFLNSINELTGKSSENVSVEVTKGDAEDTDTTDEFRKSHPTNYRTVDGHRVRSKAEAMIDNFLYSNGIVHAYEKRLPLENQTVISDFYIPNGQIYIEYWGLEENEKYAKRKSEKLKIYEENKFKLISLNEADVENLDDSLPRKLIANGFEKSKSLL